jgi:synaptic vesicle membrane protein VAT-1
MRQIWISRVGGPEVLQVREAPDPVPGPGQVRIRVKAIGVNFADTMARVGFYEDAPPIPFVPGYEVAGVIDAVGPDQDGKREGERVLALTRFGGYSDVVVVDRQQAVRLPKSCSFAGGASLPVNWMTAWHMLINLGNLKKGQRVLVQAAAGGVGVAAVQICKRAGAEVIGTASRGKHERLLHLGLDHAIDYRSQDFEAEVMRITGGKGVDIALDAVGGTSFKKSYRCLALTGRLMMFGASAATPGEQRSLLSGLKTLLSMPRFGAIKLLRDNRGVFGINLGGLWGEAELLLGYLREILAGVEQGVYQPVVDLEVPFNQAAKAHERLAARENFGKVVIVV